MSLHDPLYETDEIRPWFHCREPGGSARPRRDHPIPPTRRIARSTSPNWPGAALASWWTGEIPGRRIKRGPPAWSLPRRTTLRTGGAPGGSAPRRPVARPLLAGEEPEAAAAAVRSGWVTQGTAMHTFNISLKYLWRNILCCKNIVKVTSSQIYSELKLFRVRG